MKEARIGSLPWFAGAFWLALGLITYVGANALVYVRDGLGHPVIWLADATDWLMAQAEQCAKEAGYEE